MSNTSVSLSTVLRLVGQAYRQTKYRGGSKGEAEAAALNAYCSLHPEVADAEAFAEVAKILKASPEAALIWTEN